MTTTDVCFSVDCLFRKQTRSELFVVKGDCNNNFQWLFAERFFHHQDGLKSRTLFVIPHKFFWGIMLSSFLKRMTPYSPINQVQVQTKQIQVVEVSKHTQTTKYAPRDSTFSCVMLRWTSPKLGLMKNFDPLLKKIRHECKRKVRQLWFEAPLFFIFQVCTVGEVSRCWPWFQLQMSGAG